MSIFKIQRKREYTKYKLFGITLFKWKSYKYIRQRELAYLANLNSVNNLHQKTFPQYKNFHNGKEVVLIASGPSLNEFRPIEGAVYVGVNRACQYDKVHFDYLFCQDYGACQSFFEELCTYAGAKKFLGLLPEYNLPDCVIPDMYASYQGVERYYVATSDEKFDFTYDLASQPLGDSRSVVFSAMQFILWTHPRRIYLVGCDTALNGYYNSKSNGLSIKKVKDGWRRMKDFIRVYYPDIEVISINPVGLKGLFKDKYQAK